MNNLPKKIAENRYSQVVEYVIHVFSDFRARGVKTDFATPDIATLLDITPARAYSLNYQSKLWGMREDEADRIERKYVEHTDREIARAIERTESLKLRKYQAEMRLECKKQNSRQFGYGLTSIVSRSRSAA